MSAIWPSVRDGEFEVDASDELLWRVIGPHALDAQRVPTVNMFVLSSEDDGCLSVARDSKTTPQAAVEHREAVKEKKQYGAWAVSVNEVLVAGLRTIDDSALLPVDGPPGHAYIDHRIGPPDAQNAKVWRRVVRTRLFVLAQRRAQQGDEFVCDN